jgi:SAM-dependent methyltransferase
MVARSAGERWRAALEGWVIPEDILAAAPESPWGFPVELWRANATDLAADTPSRRRALEALPATGGSILDVGCGGGRASLAVVAGTVAAGRPAPELTGVDESEAMLERFAAAAFEIGVRPRTVAGRWPDVAGAVGTADIVVCHHVLYNVPDPARFVAGLQERARRRVVLEVTDVHPLVPIGPLFTRFHGIERPTGPSAADLAEVLREAGIRATAESYELGTRPMTHEQRVAFTRKRLCLPATRDAEVDEALGPRPEGRTVVTFWWDLSSPAAAP